MKFIRYSKFKGFDVNSLNLGDLMQSLSDSLLDSGYNDDYYLSLIHISEPTRPY